MTMTGKTVVTALAIILAGLLALAIAGFAFYASSGGASSGSDRKVGGPAPATAVWDGALS
jgi:hypothetical protein